MSSIATLMTHYPQILINVKVTNEGKVQFYKNQDIKDKIESVKNELGADGRILVRLSGTEPLVRVMLEGLDKDKITRLANETADLIKAKIGQ